MIMLYEWLVCTNLADHSNNDTDNDKHMKTYDDKHLRIFGFFFDKFSNLPESLRETIPRRWQAVELRNFLRMLPRQGAGKPLRWEDLTLPTLETHTHILVYMYFYLSICLSIL